MGVDVDKSVSGANSACHLIVIAEYGVAVSTSLKAHFGQMKD